MSKILALKQRKQTVDTIYRSSCAMQAASSIKVQKAEKILSECCGYVNDFIKNYDAIVGSSFGININLKPKKKLNLLIGCNKGFCGSFVPYLSSYFKEHYNNEEWFLIGAKLESLATDKKIKYISPTTELTQEIYEIAFEIWQYVKLENITHFSIHYFENGNIIEEQILYPSVQESKKEKDVDEDALILFLTANLSNAIWKSVLEENKQRLIAVEQAKTNAQDMVKQIERLYNRARQEKITLELNEVTAGVI